MSVDLSFWLTLILLFFVVSVGTCFLSKLAAKFKLVAEPGEHRQHEVSTPMVGGIALYIGLLLAWRLFALPETGLVICLGLMCFVGALDDRYSLSSKLRFLAQGLITYLMIKLTGVELHSLGVLFSTQELNLGAWSVAMTIFATIGVINAVNMSDGLDGLAGSLVILSLLGLLCIDRTLSHIALIVVFSIAGFLYWNLRVGRSKAVVFMGDAGSTMLGLLLAYLLIKSSQAPSGIQAVTALWLLALPLMDAVGVLIVRPLTGKSPFKADRIHYHHQLIDRGLSVNQALQASLIVQAVFIGIGGLFLRTGVNENFQLIIFLAFFFIYLVHLYFSANKRRS